MFESLRPMARRALPAPRNAPSPATPPRVSVACAAPPAPPADGRRTQPGPLLASLLLLALFPILPGGETRPGAGVLEAQVVRSQGIPQSLVTHAERSGWTELTPHEALVGFYEELARLSPHVRMREIGKSREGRPLHLVTVADPAVAEPWEAHASGKPIVFIGASVHGNEPAGKEGLMLFARELAFGAARDLLEGAVFVFMPQINPDAGEAGDGGTRANPAGYNVNRDYARLRNPESRALVEEILTPWMPHVTVDAHELTGAHAYDFYALHPSHLATPEPVREMAAGPATDAVRRAIEAAGYSYFTYHLLPSDPTRIAEEGIIGAGYGIRILRSYGGVRGGVSLLYESRRDADPRARIEERAHWQYLAMEGLARWAAEHGPEVVETVARGREMTLARGALYDPADTLVVRAELVEGERVAYRSPEMRRRADGGGFEPTGNILELQVPFRDRIEGVVVRPRPVGYLLEAHRGDLAEQLLRHGLQVEWVEGPFGQAVEHLRVDSVAVASSTAEGYFERTVWTTEVEGRQDFPRGAFLVRAAQPMAGLAFALLEPEDIDSFASDGQYDAEIRVGGNLPVHRLRELPSQPARLLTLQDFFRGTLR